VLIIIPAPLEYSVCYLEGTRLGPQAILDASSQMELYDEELDCCPIEIGVYTHQALNYHGLIMPAPQLTGQAVQESTKRAQFLYFRGRTFAFGYYPIATVRDSILI